MKIQCEIKSKEYSTLVLHKSFKNVELFDFIKELNLNIEMLMWDFNKGFSELF